MTTIIAFATAATGSPPFQFQSAFDGANYTISVKWNLSAQRWYMTITDQFGNDVVTKPVVGSPARLPITSLSWSGGIVTALSPSRLGFRIGSLTDLSVSGAAPDALNGVFSCTVVGPFSFTYPLANDPGQINAAGSWSTDINLLAGYFSTSRMVFRQSASNFEISP